MSWPDYFLWGILICFLVYESVAHFVFSNKSMHTLSWFIRRFEQAHGWKARIVVAVVVAALFVHLVLR
jgi:hypothetical protein